MNRACLGVIAIVVAAASLPSCGPGQGPLLFPVTGKVIYKGQPAAGATVTFQREDGPAPVVDGVPMVPVGQADDKGNFTVESDPGGWGAPAGKYKVLISWRSRDPAGVESQSQPAPAPGSSKKKARARVVPDKPDGAPDRLEGRFMNAEKSPFRVDVKPESNNLEPFDVSG